jgi:hypothetical protein
MPRNVRVMSWSAASIVGVLMLRQPIEQGRSNFRVRGFCADLPLGVWRRGDARNRRRALTLLSLVLIGMGAASILIDVLLG